MAASGAEEGGQLIPGLPEELLLAQVVPRLPWYTRPLCRALSKSWRTMLDTRNPELDHRTRMIQLPLLRGRFLFCTFDKHIFIRDHDIHEPQQINTHRDHDIHEPHRINGYQVQPHWRKLPPLQDLIAPPPITTIMVASSGMVYVWSDSSWPATEGLKVVVKLDMGRADWTWKKVSVPYAFNFDAVSFNGKIYVPGISTTDSQSQKKVVLEHDMATDMCRQVETWNQSDIRVLLRKSAHSNACVEEMYGFEEEDFAENLGVVMYDAASDSWRSKEEVPIPEVRWTHLPLVKLLNNDCFEPAPETGMNIVWYDHESELISWFNSSAGIIWVDIAYNPLLEGRSLEYIQFIGGSMYGIFCDEEEEEEEEVEDTKKEGGLLGLPRRAIMKGRIIVESSSVVWEEVHDIGFFRERYSADSSVIQPIDWYTVMG